jgi:hypothetical protein
MVNGIDPDGLPLNRAYQLVMYLLALDRLSLKAKFRVRALDQGEYERMEDLIE